MQVWEYCAVVGIQRYSERRGFHPRWPAIWHFTSDGIKEVEITIDEIKTTAKTIAQLGEQGWEMVSVGTISAGGESETTHILYFKRPKL